VNPNGHHGGLGSTTAHNQILDVIDASTSPADYKVKLQNWANDRLDGGAAALPPGLRP
jgi:selenophosphate synthase